MDRDLKHEENIEQFKTLHLDMQRIEDRFGNFISGLGARMDKQGDVLIDHEKRVYLLENVGRWFGWVIGALTISTVGLIITVIFKLILKI